MNRTLAPRWECTLTRIRKLNPPPPSAPRETQYMQGGGMHALHLHEKPEARGRLRLEPLPDHVRRGQRREGEEEPQEIRCRNRRRSRRRSRSKPSRRRADGWRHQIEERYRSSPVAVARAGGWTGVWRRQRRNAISCSDEVASLDERLNLS